MVAIDTFHNLVMFQIQKLIIIHLKKCPCEWSIVVRLLKKPLFLQILQAHFSNVCIIMPFSINNFWIF